ncbi:MAG TPA: hypothetical protein VFV31_10905, partial [Chitinophagaceae bacterium]|nr:hypothetical protein [Chitinophagaceae bacterium]
MKLRYPIMMLIIFSGALIISCKGKSDNHKQKENEGGKNPDSVLNEPFKNVQETIKNDSVVSLNKTP